MAIKNIIEMLESEFKLFNENKNIKSESEVIDAMCDLQTIYIKTAIELHDKIISLTRPNAIEESKLYANHKHLVFFVADLIKRYSVLTIEKAVKNTPRFQDPEKFYLFFIREVMISLTQNMFKDDPNIIVRSINKSDMQDLMKETNQEDDNKPKYTV